MKTKKPIPDYVPQGQIDWLMGRIHCGTPDAEVEADIRKRLASNPKATPEMVQACVDYALAVHHDDQDLYHSVTTGKF